jgi:hypothetical protein
MQSRFCFDTRESLGICAFGVRQAAIGRSRVTQKCRLLLDQHGHALFKPIAAILGCGFSCQRRLHSRSG